MTRDLRGYYPIMPTAYTADGSIDLDSMARLVDFLIARGAQGMSPNGGDSEAPFLSAEERMRVLDTVIAANQGRTPVLVGTTAQSTAESVVLNRHAQQAGADAVFAHPGWGRSGLDHEEIVRYYESICAVLEIPVMIHATADMDLALMEDVLTRLPQVRYIKEETSHGPKLRRYIRELGDRVTLFGPGLHYPAELGWGARGVMPSCCVPGIHARIFALWQSGDHGEARRQWNRMLPLVFWRWHTAAGEAGKVYLVREGVFTTPFVRQRVALPGQAGGTEVRFGTRTLDAVDEEEMETILRNMALTGDPAFSSDSAFSSDPRASGDAARSGASDESSEATRPGAPAPSPDPGASSDSARPGDPGRGGDSARSGDSSLHEGRSA